MRQAARGFISIGKMVINGETVVENYRREIVIGPTEGKRIGLVACSSMKASRPCAARELYTSPLFRAARAYAEATCSRWYILSAKHGLVEPSTLLDPYDQVLTQRSANAWGERVGRQLDRAVPFPSDRDAELIVLAGALYADAIYMPGNREIYFTEPLLGMGIGERLRWLQRHTPRAT